MRKNGAYACFSLLFVVPTIITLPIPAQAQVTVYTDDFNRAGVGPDWQTCGDVRISSGSLRFSHPGVPAFPGCDLHTKAVLTAPGTSLRHAAGILPAVLFLVVNLAGFDQRSCP